MIPVHIYPIEIIVRELRSYLGGRCSIDLDNPIRDLLPKFLNYGTVEYARLSARAQFVDVFFIYEDAASHGIALRKSPRFRGLSNRQISLRSLDRGP